MREAVRENLEWKMPLAARRKPSRSEAWEILVTQDGACGGLQAFLETCCQQGGLGRLPWRSREVRSCQRDEHWLKN